MLRHLSIRDVGVIAAVDLSLGPGLTVVTGETGAGKTMVVGALELLRGERAEVAQVRTGADALVVEALLDPPPAAAAEWLVDGDDGLVASREVVREDDRARSRARLGGRLAPVSALVEAVGGAIEVHGQSDSVALGRTAVQRDLLDRSGGPALAAALASYRSAHEAHGGAAAELAALTTGARERAREVDRLRIELAEIDAVGPIAGEEAALDAERSRLEHAEGLAAAAASAAAAITDDGSARDALGAAVAALRGVAGIDADLDALGGRLDGVAAEAQDVALELVGYADTVDADPARLELLRERAGALGALCRKYGPDAAAVAEYAEEARTRLAELGDGDERAEALAGRVEALAADRDRAAATLRAARRTAGAALAEVVDAHLAELAMPGAHLHVVVEPREPAAHGADHVELRLSATDGAAALGLAKAASGGERSRVALALRLAVADVDDTPVLVFDEVDAGIGGATATVVGAKLAALARHRQVLCVTHLAQLAAFATTHVVVDKASAEGTTTASLAVVDDEDRIAELARMLSGTPDSEAATAHARELLGAARA